jgi:hypothetical protein
VHAGTALAATALALDGQGTLALVLNVDALPIARDPRDHATVLQNTHVGYSAEVDQSLCRMV